MTNMSKISASRLTTVGLLAGTLLVAGIFAFMPVEKAYTDDDNGKGKGQGQSDHGLVSIPDGEKGFCGATQEPWTLNIAAAGDSDGSNVKLTFNDGDSITYPVAAGGSFSAQFAFGGVPTVDNVVKIEGLDGVSAMVVSAEAGPNSIDPFDEDDDGKLNESKPAPNETDNFCVVDPSEMDVEEDSGTDKFGGENTIIGTDDP